MNKNIDYLSLERITKLHPKIQPYFLKLFITSYSIGIPIRLTDGIRTNIEQDRLYAQGRTTPGPVVTYASSGNSFHNYGLAGDICLLLDNGKEVSWSIVDDNNGDGKADFKQVIEIALAYGFQAGWNWVGKNKDRPHLQKGFGLDIDDLKLKIKRGKVDKDGFVVI